MQIPPPLALTGRTLSIMLLAVVMSWSCTQEPTSSQCPPGYEYHDELQRCITGDTDLDASTDDAIGSDADSGSTDTDSPDDADTDGQDDDTDTEDASNTGPTDASDGEDTDNGENGGAPPECGGDQWDGEHPGDDPWDDPPDCDAVASSWDCTITEYEQQVIELINERRSEEQTCGDTDYGPSDPLEMDEDKLQCAARLHSWDMAGRGFTGHYTPEGLGPPERVSAVGGFLGGWGETISYSGPSPSAVVSSWMNSDGHCAIIMSPSYSTGGIGIYSNNATLKVH